MNLKKKTKNKSLIILISTAVSVFLLLSLISLILINKDLQKAPEDQIGKVTKLFGDVLVVKANNIKRVTAYNQMKISKYDKVFVGINSHINIKLLSGHMFKIKAESEVSFKFWDNKTNELPIYMHVNRGHIEELIAGDPNKLMLQLEKTALNKDFQFKPILIENLKNKNQLDTPPLNAEKPSIFDAKTYFKPDNKKIRRKVKSYLDQFQRCQLNALSEVNEIKGQITIGFSILPRGKTDNIQILSSNTKSQQLDVCIKSVFKRMAFPIFSGSPIFVSYPLSFK